VKIVDLAKNLIRLSGKELGVDAEIVFTGLRPGEKLHEELIVDGEDVSGTTHPKVMQLIGNERMSPSWSKQLEELIVCAITGERSGVVEKLDALVKGYRPNYEFHGVTVPPTGADAHAANASLGEASLESSSEMIPPPPKSVH
jgi:FlaA1/EpsC-like NDP-sugar epimerase